MLRRPASVCSTKQASAPISAIASVTLAIASVTLAVVRNLAQWLIVKNFICSLTVFID
jgi:hypothetical protein